jgi:hypothetical protein
MRGSAVTGSRGLTVACYSLTKHAMKKSLVPILLFAISFFGGCAAPPQSVGTQSATAQAASTQPATTQSTGTERTIWVAPPVGSLLGGGFVRVANDVGGDDEPGLISAINTLNAAAGSKQERPFVVSAVARVSGLSEQKVQAQQDQMQLRFGELLAFNTIARNQEFKVRELASLKATGKTWTDLARANAIRIATVVQTVRRANELTANSFTNSAERAKAGDRKWKDLGVHPQRRFPGD